MCWIFHSIFRSRIERRKKNRNAKLFGVRCLAKEERLKVMFDVKFYSFDRTSNAPNYTFQSNFPVLCAPTVVYKYPEIATLMVLCSCISFVSSHFFFAFFFFFSSSSLFPIHVRNNSKGMYIHFAKSKAVKIVDEDCFGCCFIVENI